MGVNLLASAGIQNPHQTGTKLYQGIILAKNEEEMNSFGGNFIATIASHRHWEKQI
ncbi:hypothetical protein [Bacillus sp. V59.32b]|uniref:hypothetical protein n=1 Tax=Bacillus sp. V59.32b TaxID=1758642 RepID=UPI001359935B|nr:hypothetical protein [Bacillus sp. V59.32b]